MTEPWDTATAHAIGVVWLRDAIAPVGGFGRRARARERLFRTGDEPAARAAIARVAAFAGRVSVERLGALRAAIGAAPDLASILDRATAGGTLDDVDFFEVGRLVDAFAEVAMLVCDQPAERAIFDDRAIDALRAALDVGRTATRSFYLDDAFDAALARARTAAVAAQAGYDAARSRLAARAAAYARTAAGGSEFVVMRDAIAGPWPPEIRIVREAPTYLLCELALDSPALEALARRDDAASRVEDEEEAVRARLSASVAGAARALEAACDALGDLDALVARARFAIRYDGVVPEIALDGAYVLVAARYEPLRDALARHGRSYAPVSLDLQTLGVVTGPNMGGKTAALRMLGFVAACVAHGVPVPAAEARVVLVDQIAWIGIGATAAGDALLSSFGAEVVGLRALLGREPGRALVLIDEFARTTSPREGRALLIALLERLRERGARGLAATHLTAIAGDAGVAHYAVGGTRAPAAGDAAVPLDLDTALARIARATDYTIVRADESAVPAADALDLAAALGLDARLVARARAALDDARGAPSRARTDDRWSR